MSAATIALDQFELFESIGEGGMGVVWRGRHVARDVPVAIKVINSEKIHNPLVHSAFRNEVRATARLAHPTIVTLFDQGQVSSEAADASRGELAAGSPYLAMELIGGGTLAGRQLPLGWTELRRLLLQILHALAHAHAHGVIHRDLKPANILVRSVGDTIDQIALTDFGIAHAFDGRDPASNGPSPLGTLRHMAPEQIVGNWRDEGPWTDLYALGTIAYRLACGRHPFSGADGDALVHCHLHAPAPRLPTLRHIPEGLDDWIFRLLAKRPANRFERAADAAWALGRLSAPIQDHPDKLRPTSPSDAARTPSDLTPTATGRSLSVALFRKRASTQTRSIAEEELTTRAESPPMPATWESAADAHPGRRLLGAGLGLYGLRPIPMVGRRTERDLLWKRLADVSTEGCRVVALCGASGNGKSRVVESIALRAEEVGAAMVLRATHSPINGSADGIAAMVASYLQCVGLDRVAVEKRCRRLIAETPLGGDVEVAVASLAELIRPDEISSVRLATPSERYRVARLFCARLARHRPVILWLDDVQWGSDALGFASFLLQSEIVPGVSGPFPVLVLLTVREELLEDRPLEAEQLEKLLTLEGSERLEIEPLAPEAHADLVRQLLGLSGELADRVAARTKGNPLFAVQLVGDWVARGVLNVGPDGFELEIGEQPKLPDDIHQVWTDRTRRIVDRMPDPAAGMAALELSAALGQDVHESEWLATCALAAIEIPAALVDNLCADGLAVANDAGWSFSHPLFRESLERNAREANRWAACHHWCASMLHGRHPEGAELGRIGLHLVEAGAHDQALEPLLAGAEGYRLTSDFHRAYQLYAARVRTMEMMKLPESDPRWGDTWVRWGRALATQGDFARAFALADKAAAAANDHGWPGVAAWAENVRGHAALGSGDTDHGRDAFEQSLAGFRATDDERGLADCLSGLAAACSWRCELEEANTYYEEAFRLHKKSRDLYELGVVLRGIGNLHVAEGELNRAGARLQRALACFEADGSRINVAKCLNDLGEVARKRGQLERAEEFYRRSGALFESLGSDDTSTPEYNLGLVFLQRENYEAAALIFTGELARLADTAHIDRLWLHVAMLPCAATRADWKGWDEHWAKVQDLLGSIVDEDIGELAELAGELADKANKRDRSRNALALARSQWLRMKRQDRVTEIDEAFPD